MSFLGTRATRCGSVLCATRFSVHLSLSGPMFIYRLLDSACDVLFFLPGFVIWEDEANGSDFHCQAKWDGPFTDASQHTQLFCAASVCVTTIRHADVR